MGDGSGTKTGFVGEDTAGYAFFHAHEEASYHTAGHRGGIESTFDNRSQYSRYRLNMEMITPSASTIYMIAMKGTSLEVTLPIRLMPPIRIRAMMIARATPMIRLTSFTASAGSTLKLLRAESMAVVIVLTCVALPVPNTASTPKAANKYARKCHFYPVRS